jgi:Fe-S-cluster-containing dehydrogenase component
MSAAEEEIKKLRKTQEDLLVQGERHLWKSVAEKAAPAPINHQKRGQEFVVLPQDQASTDPVSRRDFLKYFTAAGALIGGTACTRRPKDYLVPYVNKPEGFVYGVPVWYASSSPDGVGLLIKTREGRPIKLEGNPDHPFTKGGLDTQTQAELLNLFNPDRVRGVFVSETGRSLSWQALDEQMKAVLSSARPGSIRLLVDEVPSPSRDRAVRLFEEKTGARSVVFRDHSYEALSKAYEILGRKGVPYPRFDKADTIVSVDADFLGRWLRPTEFTKAFSSRRSIHAGDDQVNQLFVFESAYSVTGVAADYRVAIKPSQQLSVLLSLAAELSKQISIDASLVAMAGEVEGVPPGEIQKAARALAASRGRALVVSSYSGPQALACQLVAALINEALGSYGSTLDWSAEVRVGRGSESEFDRLVEEMKAGQVDVLIIQGVNPVYSRPHSDFAAALSKVGQSFTLTRELNETAKASKHTLSESHFVEAWGDSEALAGSYSIQQPVIEPLFDSRSLTQCLLAWAGDSRSDQDFVKSVWKESVFANAKASSGFDAWWQDQLRVGHCLVGSANSAFSAKGGTALSFIEAARSQKSSGLELVAIETLNMTDGRNANNAWLQELPEPISKVTWGNFVALSPEAAKQLGVHQHDEIEVKSDKASVKLSVFVQPGIRNDVAVVPLGYGRTQAGTLGSGVGASIYAFSLKQDAGISFSGAKISLVKTGGRKELATTQHHFDLHGRDHDILQQTTLAEFRKDPKAAKDPVLDKMKLFSMYDASEHPYPGNRWGMAIDLNKCTGCQACVVACYSENNIGIVGKDQVSMGRHLAWLRLDLYYTGDESSPAATFEPMLCQQCERAPCETVCPVLATVHSSDGLNDMIYNRCVGTRYCANNCPYKVRRFNYFHYSKAMAGRQDISEESPISLMFNPDVTVRSRGVMEKCTFCVQRIRKGVDEIKEQAGKDFRYRVPDGHIQTACQQSCPADAITFGDLNDENSRVNQMAKKAQAFKVLAVLNTNPSVSYLPRIRNKGEEA